MQRGHVDGERYCGNYVTRKVHDLQNEHENCLVNDFIDSGNDIPFINLEIAQQSGYTPCEYCFCGK